jgi:glycosyltransferase involved in cell wall biosynthesis
MSSFFSIIIPCYNQAIYLPDCLNSLLEQSYTDWEAIVVNDGSSDSTNEVARDFCNKDPRIKLIEKVNGGLSSARNVGIKNARGNRFIFLDADDYFYPNYLLEINNAIKNSDDLTIVQSGYTYITEDKKYLLKSVNPSPKENLIPEILTSSLGPCHTICITKELCKKAGWFDENLKSVEDWDYWIRVAKSGAKYLAIKKPLVYYRYAKNSMSRNAFVMYDALKKVIGRATKKDDRITIDSLFNKPYEIDTTKVLQDVLIRSIGVSIMQGKIKESLSLFKNETPKSIAQYQPKEFEPMCSYLSFRYWYSKEEIETLIKNIIPNFIYFFKKVGYTKSQIKKSIFYIFNQHFYHRNIYKYGRALGKIINSLMRKMEMPLLVSLEI